MATKTKEPVCIHGQSTAKFCRHCQWETEIVVEVEHYRYALKTISGIMSEPKSANIAVTILQEYKK